MNEYCSAAHLRFIQRDDCMVLVCMHVEVTITPCGIPPPRNLHTIKVNIKWMQVVHVHYVVYLFRRARRTPATCGIWLREVVLVKESV